MAVFIVGLLIGGATAIPLEWGANMANNFVGNGTRMEKIWPEFADWISLAHQGIREMYGKYPFLTYGNDWLAFGHFMIAIAFVGVFKSPARNRWVVDFGLIACVLVIPYAMIFGAIRGIPLFWRVIDSLFGVIGFIPLWIIRAKIKRLSP